MAEQVQDNTLLVEEMMRGADAAPEPGALKQGQLAPEGTKEIPLGINKLESAGYVFIYDTITGEQSKINKNMAHSKLSQKRLDGSYIFSLHQKVIPVRGTYKCLLHPDQPDRAYFDNIGLPTCKKDNLTSLFQVERHMQKRHKQEWATIQADKERKDKLEDRAFQKSIIQMATGKAPVEPLKAEKAQDIEPDDLPWTNPPAEEPQPAEPNDEPKPKRTYKKHNHRKK